MLKAALHFPEPEAETMETPSREKAFWGLPIFAFNIVAKKLSRITAGS